MIKKCSPKNLNFANNALSMVNTFLLDQNVQPLASNAQKTYYTREICWWPGPDQCQANTRLICDVNMITKSYWPYYNLVNTQYTWHP